MQVRSSIQNQAGHPSGLVGKLFGRTMNLFNHAENRWAIELLDIVTRHQQLNTHRQYTPELICSLMKDAGFVQVFTHEGPSRRFPVFWVTGRA